MKKILPKTHMLISKILMYIGTAFAAIDILYDLYTGVKNENLPWAIVLGLIFFIIGIAYRFIFVRCPHCGDGLTASKELPKECPVCGKPLDVLPEDLPEEDEEDEEDVEDVEDEEETDDE